MLLALRCRKHASTLLNNTRRSLSINMGKDALTIPSLSPSTTFPYTWLRDACPCPRCVHPSTGQKLHRSSDVVAGADRDDPRVLVPTSVRAEHDGIRIEWRSGIHDHDHDHEHTSFYPLSFLARYVSPSALAAYHHHQDAAPRTPWTASHFASTSHSLASTFTPYAALSNPRTLLSVYERLLRYGIVFFRDVQPVHETSDAACALRRLAQTLGCSIRTTFYGDTWDVRSVRESKNIAYTSLGLDLHMDLLYFKHPPKYQVLHCLRNRVQGGHSIFVDGLAAAHQLHAAARPAFNILASAPVAFQYINDGHHLYTVHRTFEFEHASPSLSRGEGERGSSSAKGDLDGDAEALPHPSRIRHINYSPPFQAPLPLPLFPNRPTPLSPLSSSSSSSSSASDCGSSPASTISDFYRALAAYAARLDDPANRLVYTLRPGDAVLFDNRRILHGRSAFEEEDSIGAGYVESGGVSRSRSRSGLGLGLGSVSADNTSPSPSKCRDGAAAVESSGMNKDVEKDVEKGEGETRRWLKGCYLEEDPVLDRMRMLALQFGRSDE